MMFKAGWSNRFLMPLKRSSLVVISCNEFINSLSYLADRNETGPLQRLTPKDAKPALYLIEPGGMRWRVGKMNMKMALQPAIFLGLMSVKVIQHHVDFFIRIACYHFVHKIQKLPASAALVVPGLHQSRCHLKSGKQGGGSMSLVLMIESLYSLTIWKTQPALGTFQCLDARLLINADYQGILRWLKIEAYDIRCLLGKLRVCAHTPTPAPPQVNAMLAKHSPDLVIGYIPQALCQKFSGPCCIPFRWRTIKSSQNTLLGSLIIFLTSAFPWSISKSRNPLLGKADAPFTYRSRTQRQTPGDLLSRSSRCALKHNAGPLYQTLFR